MNKDEAAPSVDFIRTIINEDMSTNKYGGRVHTRFPPEPNGYLHIGHAKSICLNFGVAEDYGGKANMRFDDTNPTKEEVEYVESIQEDVRWLGFDWDDRLFYASDYFDQLYEYAVQLIKKGKAYVDDLSAAEIREYRGTLTEPGKESPYRDRSVEQNLDLFERMKACEFPDGSRTLRAKIDMASPNITLRDPVLYRILKVPHHRTGDEWCIYPMYDFAHGQSDSLENITHSICTLEFQNNRELYDWIVDSELTPYLLVTVDDETVQVPQEYVSEGKIVLNVSPMAVRDLDLGQEAVIFSGRFGGRPFPIHIPIASVQAVYAKETGEGMMFEPESIEPQPDPPPESDPPGGSDGPSTGNHLKVVK